MKLHGWLAAIFFFSLFFAPARSGRADEPTPSELGLARSEYSRGVAASKKERWEEAYEAFFRAYELSQRPAIFLNLGSAQAKTGRLVEARESYRAFLREAPKGEVAKHKRDAESVLKDLDLRIPKAVIVVDGIEALDRLVIDQQEVAKAVLGGALPLNPGAHEIEVMREGGPPIRAEVTLVERETKSVRLNATRTQQPEPIAAAKIAEVKIEPPPVIKPPPVVEPPPPVTKSVAVTAIEPEKQDGILESPILWIAAGVVAVGGAIAIGFALSGDEERYRGSTGIVLEAP